MHGVRIYSSMTWNHVYILRLLEKNIGVRSYETGTATDGYPKPSSLSNGTSSVTLLLHTSITQVEGPYCTR